MRAVTKILLALSLVMLVPGTPAHAQVPSGVLSSSNVQLLASLPEPGAVGGRFAEVNGTRYFLSTAITGVYAWDVTNPELPLLAGYLPLPHYENEDVDSCGGLMTIARDPAFDGIGGLYVLDVRHLPLITPLSTNPQGFTSTEGASFFGLSDGYFGGHTASFVTADCRYVYATAPGGADVPVFVIDLQDPANPQVVNELKSVRSGGVLPGGTHDFTRDSAGVVWAVGDSGITAMSVADPVHPQLYTWSDTSRTIGGPGGFNHNSLRPHADQYHPRTAPWHKGDALAPGEKLLIGNEELVSNLNALPLCIDQGHFATASAVNFDQSGTADVEILDSWKTEYPAEPATGTQIDGNQATPPIICSAHWFDERNDFVAVGWYQQGTRILDVSDPYHIRQVGYFLTPDALTWSAYWVDDTHVLSLDQTHGINVLKVDVSHAGPTVAAHVPAGFTLPLRASAARAYSCVIRKPSTGAARFPW